ncbi:MAG: haloacid dehalogenase [Bacteriovoracia bacterium]
MFCSVFSFADECAPFPKLKKQGWRHYWRTPLFVTSQGDPWHSTNDSVANTNFGFTIDGKFTYGSFSKDLEDERVSLWIRSKDCKNWYKVGERTTDHDGRADFSINAGFFKETGVYKYRMVVNGDLSYVEAKAWVVPSEQKAVLFDIDGTLTTSDGELIEELIGGWTPEMYEDANELAQRYARKGYLILYVTGRPYLLRDLSKEWLSDMGFPDGPLHLTDFVSDSLTNVEHYKEKVLKGYLSGKKIKIKAAYGNAQTDICAYAKAGIDPLNTYIIGPNAGNCCEGFKAPQGINNYKDHMDELIDTDRLLGDDQLNPNVGAA